MSRQAASRSYQSYIVAITGFGILSGIFSPFQILVLNWLQVLAPGLLIGSATILQFLTSLVTATLVIVVGGAPAALFERATGRRTSDDASMWIWLAGVAFLSLPAIFNLLAAAR